jgi:hypothetical protein
MPTKSYTGAKFRDCYSEERAECDESEEKHKEMPFGDRVGARHNIE